MMKRFILLISLFSILFANNGVNAYAESSIEKSPVESDEFLETMLAPVFMDEIKDHYHLNNNPEIEIKDINLNIYQYNNSSYEINATISLETKKKKGIDKIVLTIDEHPMSLLSDENFTLTDYKEG